MSLATLEDWKILFNNLPTIVNLSVAVLTYFSNLSASVLATTFCFLLPVTSLDCDVVVSFLFSDRLTLFLSLDCGVIISFLFSDRLALFSFLDEPSD